MIFELRRIALNVLIAIAVVVGTAGCETADIAAPFDTGDDPELRVDVQWRLALATDRLWELAPRELGEPVIAPSGDLLVGATNGWVYRIRSGSGEVIWGRPVGGSVDNAVQYHRGTVYVGTGSAELVAVDWNDGDEQWRFEADSSVESTPAVASGRVFATDSEDRLYAVDAESGELEWDFRHEAPEFFTIKGGGQPLVVDGVVYCGFSDGQLTALDAEQGEEIWSVYLGTEEGEFGDIDLPIYHRGDQLVATSHAGGIHGVERQTGALLWHVEAGDVTGAIMRDNWLFATTATGRVLAVDTSRPEIAWEHELDDDQMGSDIGFAGPYLAVSTFEGPMHLLRLRNGAVAAKWAPSNGFQNAPVFDERRGYVMSNRGYLYGFGLAY